MADTAELRRIAGLGVHVTEVCKCGRAFLKGFFNAVEAFRHNRDLDGWKLGEAMDHALRLELSDATRREVQADYSAATRITE